MAKVVTISIVTVNSSYKKQTTNVSYVNPEATNENLREFASKLIALTDDTYLSMTKITKESVA